MTEFDYDVKQRTSLARQAKYKKNGSKSKKCPLCQDHMTDAQLRKMNGKVIGFSMNKPIRSWKDFKAISPVSATEYIVGLDSAYDVSIGDLADMFGVTYNTVRDYLSAIGCPVPHGRMKKDLRDKWQAFLISDSPTPADEPKIFTIDGNVKEPETEIQEPQHEEVHTNQDRVEAAEPGEPMFMREFSLEFSGQIDLNGIMNSLRYMIGESASGTLKVAFSAREE